MNIDHKGSQIQPSLSENDGRFVKARNGTVCNTLAQPKYINLMSIVVCVGLYKRQLECG